MITTHAAASEFAKSSAEGIARLDTDASTMSADETISASIDLLGMALDALRAGDENLADFELPVDLAASA